MRAPLIPPPSPLEEAEQEVEFLEKVVSGGLTGVFAERAKVALGTFYHMLSQHFHEQGIHPKALEYDNKAYNMFPDEPVIAYNKACSHACLKQRTEALAFLEVAVNLGLDDRQMVLQDPDWEGMHDDERFQTIVGAM